MRDFERSATIATSPDRLFNYLADVRHLSEFVPRVLDAKARDTGDITIIFDMDGLAYELDGWLRADEQHRSLEWGIPSAGYQGWLTIKSAPDGCELVVNVQTPSIDHHVIYTEYELSFDERTGYELEDVLDTIRAIMDRHAD
jgi:hypothetical protein